MPKRGVRPHRVTVVRWLDAAGNRVPAGTGGAAKAAGLSETWYAKLGGRRVSLKTADEGEAWIRLRALLKRRSDEAAGIVDAYTDAAALPLPRHIEAWLADVAAAACTPHHLGVLRARLSRLAAAAGWRRLHDLSASSALRALAEVKAEGDLNAATRNGYLAAAKQFARWCAGPGRRRRDNPLAELTALPVEDDRRHSRRCPADDEISRLFAWLLTPGASARRSYRHGGKSIPLADGRARALGYRVAMCGGLRAGELRTLTRAAFDLGGGAVIVRAAYDKRGRLAVQPLPSWLCADLAAHFGAGGRCWEWMPEDRAAAVLRYDLAGAGIPYVTEGADGPEFFDFHALRHWYCTTLASDPAVTPRTLQALARHHSPAFTLKVYAKARTEDVRAAADRLPRPGG